ncbi:hypothetical protein PMV_133 [Port-miou virus]|nr:hypothetical protein PMV_133 [Port-miou virus]
MRQKIVEQCPFVKFHGTNIPSSGGKSVNMHFSNTGKFVVTVCDNGELLIEICHNGTKFSSKNIEASINTICGFILSDPAYAIREMTSVLCGKISSLSDAIQKLSDGIEFAPGSEACKEIQKNFEELSKINY